MVVDVRLQPRICGGCSDLPCTVEPGLIYDPDDARFESLNLDAMDVRARVVHASNDFSLDPSLLCLFGCDLDEREEEIRESLVALPEGLGALLSVLINPPRLQIRPQDSFAAPEGSTLAEFLDAQLCPAGCAASPSDGNACLVPDALCLVSDAARLNLLGGVAFHPLDLGTAQVRIGGTGDPVQLGGAGGAWTDTTFEAFREGAELLSVDVDFGWLQELNDDFAARCNGGADPWGCFFLSTVCRGPSPSPFCGPLTSGIALSVPLSAIPAEERTSPPMPTVAQMLQLMPALGAATREFFSGPLLDGMEYSEITTEAGGARFRLLSDADDDCVANVPTEVFPVEDNCKDVANPEQADTDEDGIGDACDTCPDDRNTAASNLDTDGDGIGDACDCDADGDGCPARYRADGDGVALCSPGATGFDDDDSSDGGDQDLDGVDDDCDVDDDGDGIDDAEDNCPNQPNVAQADLNGDGEGDLCDLGCSPNGVRLDPDCPDSPLPVTTDHYRVRPGLTPFECLQLGRACSRWAGLDFCDQRFCDPEVSQTFIAVYVDENNPAWQLTPDVLGYTTPFGEGVARIPDVNRDGVQDLVVPAPREAFCRFEECADGAGILAGIDGRTGELLWEYSPAIANAELGAAVAVDQDTVYVSAPGLVNASGERTGGILVLDVSGSEPRLTNRIYGPVQGEDFGRSIDLLRIDGITVGMLVGAPQASPNLMAAAGRIYGMATSGEIFQTFDGPVTFGRLGSGSSTMILPNPIQETTGGVISGIPHAFGERGGVVAYNFDGSIARLVLGEEAAGRLGATVVAGDFDASGITRIATSEPGGNAGHGRVRVLDERLFDVVTAEGPLAEGGQLDLRSPGDLDGDGLGDLTIGMRGLSQAGERGAFLQWSFDEALPAPQCPSGGCTLPEACVPTYDWNWDGVADCDAQLADHSHESWFLQKLHVFIEGFLDWLDGLG